MSGSNERKYKTLYGMYRDGIISGALENDGEVIHEWKLIPEVHIGRLPTMTLIRKMTRRLLKDFPGGLTNKHGKITLTPEFMEFAKTHRSLNSTDEEVKQAWAAMRSMTE